MSDLLPVHEILAVVERNSRIILETAGHEIIVLSDTAYALIGIKSLYDRIGVSLSCGGDRYARKQESDE